MSTSRGRSRPRAIGAPENVLAATFLYGTAAARFQAFSTAFHRDVLLRQRLIHRDAIARSRRGPNVPPDFPR
jgi:hypothetical protein